MMARSQRSVYTTDNNEYNEQSPKKQGMKIFVKKRNVLKIAEERNGC